MTKKKLSLLKAFSSMAILIICLAFVVFFCTYGRVAIQNAIDNLQTEPTPEGAINLSGLGPAILLVYSIVMLFALILPMVMGLIAMIGNFASGGKKVVGFTVVALISEIIAMPILFFLTTFFLGATMMDLLTVLVTALFDLSVVVGFIISIVVLVKQKNAVDE